MIKILFIVLLFSLLLSAHGEEVTYKLSASSDRYSQGEVISYELVFENSTSKDYGVFLNLWRESNLKYEVFRGGQLVERLYSGEVRGGIDLGSLLRAESEISLVLLPGLYWDMSVPGDYEVSLSVSGASIAERGDNNFVELNEISKTVNLMVEPASSLEAVKLNQKWFSLLESDSRSERDGALRALISTRMDEAADAIYSESLNNRDLRNGLYGLARMNTEHSINLLSKAVLSGNSRVVESALHQIGNFHLLTLEGVVKSQLDSSDARIRKQAKWVIERLEYAKKNGLEPKRFKAPDFLSSGIIASDSAEVKQTVSKSHKTELEGKESVEVKPFEVEEAPEQSSQLWLWLVVALIVLGGLAVVVRRKP